MDQVQALALAIGRHIGEAERIGLGHRTGKAGSAIDRRRIGPRRNRAVEAEQQVFLALADQTADARAPRPP